MSPVVGIVIMIVAIVFMVWIFFFREPKKKEAPKEAPKENLIVEEANDLGLPSEFFEDLKSILGPDFEHPQIKLVWDDFTEKPSDFAYYELITTPLLSQDKLKKAEEFMAFASNYVTQNYKIYQHLGDIRAKISDLRGAEDAYKRAADLNPEESDSMMNLGFILIGLEQYEKAHDILAKILVTSPDNLRARLYLGMCLYHLGRYEDAYTELNAVYKKDQRVPQVHYFIGLCFIQMNSKKSAHMALSRYMKMHPDGMYAMDAARAIEEIEAEMPELANNTEEAQDNTEDTDS